MLPEFGKNQGLIAFDVPRRMKWHELRARASGNAGWEQQRHTAEQWGHIAAGYPTRQIDEVRWQKRQFIRDANQLSNLALKRRLGTNRKDDALEGAGSKGNQNALA